MNISMKQVGQKYRLIASETGAAIRQMGPRKLSKNRAEYRQAVLSGEVPYDYPDDPTSSEVSAAVDSAIESYKASQDATIATNQAKIDTEQANIASQEAAKAAAAEQLEAGEITQEEYDAAVAAADKAIAKSEKNIASAESKIATAEANKENAAKKVTSVTIEDVPETLVLNNTGYKVTVKTDFSAHDTVIEANEKLTQPVSIQNTGEPGNLTLDLGNSEASISGNWNEVVVKSVADNTLTVNTTAHIRKLVVLKGRVHVNNAFVEDNVDEYEGNVEANETIKVSGTGVAASKFVGTPRVTQLSGNTEVGNLAFAISANGNYVWDINGKELKFTRKGFGGVLVRGGKVNLVIVDLDNQGQLVHEDTTPLVWCSDKESSVKICGGKFITTNNECIYAENGTIEILDGEFHNEVPEGSKNYLLNCKDANYKAGNAKIVVKGGKFYGFDPANCETEGAGTNFVAEGFKSVDQGEYFEVVPEE